MKAPNNPFLICCTLAIGSATMQGAVLLTSFETAGELFPTTATNTPIVQSGLHATNGASSMAVTVASGNWAWSTKSFSASTYSDWHGHTKMTIDLSRVTTLLGGNIEIVVAINGPQGWQQKQLLNWPWQNAGKTTTYSGTGALKWDYTAIRNAAPAPTGGSDWWQINFMARSTYTGQTVYLDNIQFVDAVPEPGSLILLGLAGTFLAARRRR